MRTLRGADSSEMRTVNCSEVGTVRCIILLLKQEEKRKHDLYCYI
jgi:hypothetical protein